MHNQDRMIPGGEYRKINVMDTFAARGLKEVCPDSIWNSKEYLAYTLKNQQGHLRKNIHKMRISWNKFQDMPSENDREADSLAQNARLIFVEKKENAYGDRCTVHKAIEKICTG